MIEKCFNFLNTLPVSDEYSSSIRMYLHWKKLFYKFLVTDVAYSMVKVNAESASLIDGHDSAWGVSTPHSGGQQTVAFNQYIKDDATKVV